MTTDLRARLARAKEIVSIQGAWTRLGLPDPPQAGRDGVVRSPFREDRHPSFSIYGGGRHFRDHAHAEHAGDVVDFVQLATNRSKAEAIATLLSLAGDNEPLRTKTRASSATVAPSTAYTATPPPSSKPPPSLANERPLTAEEAKAIAQSRLLPAEACDFLGAAGYLISTRDRDGEVAGWTLVDAPGWPSPRPGGPSLPTRCHVAETRRLDRQPFAHGGKGHTWTGSRKNWPVGISALSWPGYRWRAVLAVEGGPDLLSAHAALALLGIHDVLPISLLSREIRLLHPEAAELLRGHRVHIIPHNDLGEEHGHGRAAAERWAADIFHPAGAARVSVTTLETLTRPDNEPAKDLTEVMEGTGHIRNRDALPHLFKF